MKALYVDNSFKQFNCILHPFESFYEIKHKNKGSFVFTAAVLIVWFLASIFQRQSTGYLFNFNKLNELNIFMIFIKTLVFFAVWVVSNWSVTTFIGGIGKFPEIWLVSAYALIPHIASTILVTVISNVFTINEGVFLQYITFVGILWSSALMLIGLMTIHDYEFMQTVGAVILTVLAIAIILFLFVLFYTLVNQLFTFLYTVFSEVLYRL